MHRGEQCQAESPAEKERHILVAVDDTDSSRRAVLYVADFLGGSPGFRITLFHVLSVPQEECFATGAERETWTKRHEGEARDLLERFRRMLVQSGFPEEKVGTSLITSESGSLADTILEAHENLGTCTVVIGRRSKSRQEEFLFGSVSSAIVKQAQKCSVWVVE